MSSKPSSDPLPLSVSPTNLSESLSSETQSPPEPQTPSAPQSLPISQHPAASSGSTALHLDTLRQSPFDEAPLHQPDQSLVLNFQDPSPERLHSPVPPSALPRFTRPTPLPRFLSRPPAIEPSTSELVLALRALVRPQEPSLERILPHLRPLKSFADPWDFLEALNRTFSTLSVPEDAFGKLLVWTLSTDSPGLADFIESQYPNPDSFAARPSWKSIQASLLDRVEGPGSQQRRLRLSASLPDSRMYRLCTPERAALKKWIEDCLERGHIRRSKSPAGAGIFFVKKKDKSLRLCIDYRLLNRMTIANRFPLPLPDALLDRIFAARPCVFTKIDLKSAFNLLCIRESVLGIIISNKVFSVFISFINKYVKRIKNNELFIFCIFLLRHVGYCIPFTMVLYLSTDWMFECPFFYFYFIGCWSDILITCLLCSLSYVHCLISLIPSHW